MVHGVELQAVKPADLDRFGQGLSFAACPQDELVPVGPALFGLEQDRMVRGSNGSRATRVVLGAGWSWDVGEKGVVEIDGDDHSGPLLGPPRPLFLEKCSMGLGN